jgi:hypothetical protein
MKGAMRQQRELILKVRLRSSLFHNYPFNLRISFCCLIGLRVGQIRLIFALPDYLRGRNLRLPKYNACIEWFSAFRAPNPDSNLFSVTRSRRNNAPVTEIVPLDSIKSSCYLTPRFGTTYHPARWSSADVLEDCHSFTLNKYISLALFYELENG